MKKVYKITVLMGNELSTIVLTNPNRNLLKVGNSDESGIKIIKVERV